MTDYRRAAYESGYRAAKAGKDIGYCYSDAKDVRDQWEAGWHDFHRGVRM